MRPPQIRLYGELVIDGFAGGGGTSTGIAEALGRGPDLAINHDPEALAMHAANHPETEHLCSNIRDVNPRRATAGKPVALAWFSPDCTFHSKARGGKPHRDRHRARRIRGLVWEAVRWAKQVKPRIVVVENVEELKDWGPLGSDGRPDPSRRGESFARWVSRLRNLGYAVEWRELRACDFGAPTSRKRLFVIARNDARPIVWPLPTHGPRRRQPYRTAAECIDWSIACPSIFDRARPLAENTLRRIARGIRRYVLDAREPFIVPVTHQGDARAHSLREPFRTITGANRGELALVAPTLIQTGYGERHGRHGEQAPRVPGLDKPLGTVVAGGAKHALVAAFLARHYGGHENDGAHPTLPMFTITTQDHHALVTSHLLKLYGSCQDGRPLTEPMPTVTANGRGGGHLAEVRAFLLKYYGTDQDPELRLPLATVTTRDRFGLVTVTVSGEEYFIADIGMRMLTPRELYRAQGFPDDYQIERGADGRRFTKTAQTRMCGNSVPPPAAAAIVRANVLEAA